MTQSPTARVDLSILAELTEIKLSKWHASHGEDAWLPIPDLAPLIGVSNNDAVEAAVRLLLDEQKVVLESSKLRGFTDDRYKRAGEKGWWPAVRLLPPEVQEARRKRVAEHRRNMERVDAAVNEALEVAGMGDTVRAVCKPDGRVVVIPAGEGAEEVGAMDAILRALPAAVPEVALRPGAKPAHAPPRKPVRAAR